jgi:hypothetical protein
VSVPVTSSAPFPGAPLPSQRPGHRVRNRVLVGALAFVVAAAAALIVPQLLDGGPGGDDAGPNPTASASGSAPASPSASPGASEPDPNVSPGMQWADSERFMEISGGEVRGGQVFLKVRVATKEPLGESFETRPGTGPFVEVRAADDARAIRLRSDPRGPQSDMEELVEDLEDRRGDDVVEGFDVRFSAFGLVQQVEWLFNPGG